MAGFENRQYLVNLHSNATVTDTDGTVTPKAPSADKIEEGEIAVNYAAGKESIFIKNSEGEVVRINKEFSPVISSDYESSEYPEVSGATFIDGADNVDSGDTYEEAINKVEKNLVSLAEKVTTLEYGGSTYELSLDDDGILSCVKNGSEEGFQIDDDGVVSLA